MIQSTDMRKSIDGLAILVQMSFKLDPFSDALFVFCNAKRDKIKLLYWERNGFWLYYRRLERGRFKWPENPNDKVMHVTERELRWLLDGLDIQQKGVHQEVKQRKII
ncbi:IS66 family insertion sequence element accessory protein TnpB [Tepidibacillus decaturensis]|uniref:Transposase n=1 Tax=Tepidibacillus decaturensis TaxID=1413211 RepID=A0A135L4R0_9BACI|nr:IS66 family insertion sequence element accessory protein TnpB [Tepidibacillus decaturensis]KXG43946.1 transposase [Tepidibacillus decaturensis]